MPRIIPRFTATRLQAFTYLAGVALFSISFLVFLNASISFVVTDVIGQRAGVGDAVGTLGFADELVALAACPFWGLVSDRIGVRWVAVTGYCIIGSSLVCLVQSGHVYPDLIIWRMVFSIGAAACSTMVTAILPAMTARVNPIPDGKASNGGQQVGLDGGEQAEDNNTNRRSIAASVSSDLTITPARFQNGKQNGSLRSKLHQRPKSLPEDKVDQPDLDPAGDASRLAGFVGMFTGIGALVALLAFLPLPTLLGKHSSKAEAVRASFYVVGGVAVCVAILVGFGLNGLPGESSKGFRRTSRDAVSSATTADPDHAADTKHMGYLQLTRSAIALSFTDADIATGYMGGFVARASSVAISTFIPLLVNAYFIRTGLCTSDPSSALRDSCKRAYKVASMLTGISQLVALLAAPLYGFFNARYASHPRLSRLPLIISTLAGIIGYAALASMRTPDPKTKDGRGAILAVTLIGLSQIGAIVCSLGILARGIQNGDANDTRSPSDVETDNDHERTPLLLEPGLAHAATTSHQNVPSMAGTQDRSHLKGSIAGAYSLSGGLAILILNKLGGLLFDRVSEGGPFYLMAGFNAVLFVAVGLMEVVREATRRRSGTKSTSNEDNE